MHTAFGMVRDGTWDPDQYLYPPLPRTAVAAASILIDRVSRFGGGHPLRDQIRAESTFYDELEPFAFLLAARVLSVAAGILTIVLTGLMAERLVPGAGGVAALVAAFVPALVLRGSIATIDSFATVAVLGCLYLTDRSRTSSRPFMATFGAGVFAGLAFASKYPSVLVVVAVATTTLLLPARIGEKATRLAATAGGTLLGALIGIPALLRHVSDIAAALKQQRLWYQELSADPSLWHQALVRMESNLHFSGPEVGIVAVALAALGLVVGLRRRDLAPTVAGWCAFAIVSFALYGSQRYRPFRNLMPLVPVGCVAAAIGYRWVRARVSRARWLDAFAAAALLILFGLPTARYVRDRMSLVDPRRQAIDWLAARFEPRDGVVYLRDLVILDGELARLPGERWPASLSDADAIIRARSPRFVIAGVLAMPDAAPTDMTALPILQSDYEPVFRAGATPTIPIAGWWRGNDEIVAVLERKNSRRAEQGPAGLGETARPGRR